MLIAVPSETFPGERRVALIPASVKALTELGAEVHVQTDLGIKSGFSNKEYEDAGAKVTDDRSSLLSTGDIVLRVRKPSTEEVSLLKQGAIHVSYLDPFNDQALVTALANQGVSAISMEMIPRSTRAQKMDALSSQANLAGYVMVLLAADKLDSIFPMMMTPSGTIPPARVFIIGAGVAGLQAIATAKRLGAKVEAFDTRPVVAEQVRSLGAKFVEIDLGEMGQTEDGYAKQLTEAQLELQREGMKQVIARSDIVITTAQVFGRSAPRIVTRDMVEAMQPGSVIVDMAVESGGNVEGSVLDEVVDINGVTIIGYSNLPGRVSKNASQMYSTNLLNLVSEFWNEESGEMLLPQDDEIIQACLITHEKQIVNETIKNLTHSNTSGGKE
jgi:NAD(P) transhydrogenase subunit alpha